MGGAQHRAGRRLSCHAVPGLSKAVMDRLDERCRMRDALRGFRVHGRRNRRWRAGIGAKAASVSPSLARALPSSVSACERSGPGRWRADERRSSRSRARLRLAGFERERGQRTGGDEVGGIDLPAPARAAAPRRRDIAIARRERGKSGMRDGAARAPRGGLGEAVARGWPRTRRRIRHRARSIQASA